MSGLYALADVLAEVMPVEVDEDGALTVRRDGTVAALRTVALVEGLAMISLTQVLAWDLPCTDELRAWVAAEAGRAMFGTVTLTEQPDALADVMLRYNFPHGVDARALKILVPMVLDTGAQLRRTLTG